MPRRSIEENERTSGSLRNKIFDSYLLFVLGASDGHSLRHHVDSKDDLSDTSASKSLNLVAQDGLVSEVDQWFGHSDCHGSQPSAEPAY